MKRGLKIAPRSDEGDTGFKLTFVEYVNMLRPNFIWGEHNRRLAAALQKVADGKIKRLIVQMPPRHGKSELVSRLFPAYYLLKHPEREVGLGSYGADLAVGFSANARANFEAAGGVLDKSTRAKDDWRVAQGGGMWAAGVNGGMTGRGYHLGIVDDVFAGVEDSGSRVQRDHVKEWFDAVFMTRQAPECEMILIGTRWHSDDLIGYVLETEREAIKEEEDDVLEHWHIIDYPALALDGPLDIPESCTLEPDWRREGEPLWPERYGLKRILKFKSKLKHFFECLYQQRPVVKGGDILKRSWFNHRLHISQVPTLIAMVGGVDLAYTKKDSADYTVCFPLGVDQNGRYYLFRPYREQQEATAVLDGIAARARECGCSVIGIENVAAQSAYVTLLRERNDMMGVAVVGVPRTGDKEALARNWAPIAEQGLITLVTDGTGWEEVFLDEIEVFPRGANDDQADAVGIGFETLRLASGGVSVAGTPAAVTETLARLRR